MREGPMEIVVVTGGAGYIGSHACKALATAGFQPLTVDNFTTGHREAVKWGPCEVVDVRDTDAFDRVIKKYRPVGVLHFAAHIEVGESVRAPLTYYDNNIRGLVSTLEAMMRNRLKIIVFSSTAAIYGEPDRVPVAEDAPVRPGNPYGASKSACERILADVSATGDLRYLALRYFNAAGADPDGEIGEAHNPETHLIPNALRAIIGDGPPLTVHGDDFPTPDGTAIRDYVHVSDLADAHVQALRYLMAGRSSCTLNVGTGTGHTVRSVIDTCERVLGTAPPYAIGPRRPGDPARLVAAADQIRSTLNWQPRQSDLDNILATAARWYKAL